MSSHDFGGEIVLRSGESEAKLPDIPRPILQALHNSLVGVEENHSVHRARAVRCKVADLEQLMHMLGQWVAAYGPISYSQKISIIVIPKDRVRGMRRVSFKSYESFVSHYLGTTDRTRSLSLTVNVVLKLPERDVLDRVQLEVSLRSRVHGHLFYSNINRNGVIDEDYEEDEGIHYPDSYYNLNINTRYTSYLLAKGGIDVVDQWFEGLPLQKVQLRDNYLSKILYRDYVFESFAPAKAAAFALPAITSAALIWASIGSGTINNLFSLNEIENIILFSAVISSLMVLFYAFIFQAAVSIERPKMQLLEINEGDRRCFSMLEERNGKLRRRRNFWQSVIVASFIVNIAASLLMYYLLP